MVSPSVHPPSAPRLSVFGKTPGMGDFVRVGHGGLSGQAFEEWIQRGLELAEAKRGAAWAPAYGAGETYAFVYRPAKAVASPDVMVGVLKPSRDAVGRRFPLVVQAAVTSQAQVPWPHVLPMALGDFLDAAVALLFASDVVRGLAEVQANLMRVSPPDLYSGDRCAQEYEAWASATPLEQAWSIVYGGDASSSPPRAVHTILEAVAPFRGDGAPPTKLGLRVPLGPGGVAAAAFWLDVVRRVARTPLEIRSAFWCFDGTTGSAIIQLGDTPASALGDMWAPDPNSDFLCDLTTPTSVDTGRFLGKLPAHVAEVLQAKEARVRDFLDRLTV